MGILCTVLLPFYSGMTFQIFIKIGSYWTDMEQKVSWHSFLRHCVVLFDNMKLSIFGMCRLKIPIQPPKMWVL